MSAQGAMTDPELIRFVDDYLQACEDRELERATGALADDVSLEFPGPTRFTDLHTMAAASSGRYRWVRKHRDHYAVGRDLEGRTVVTSRGRLYGENLHGVPFEDVRYVDVFVLAEGRIVEQHVWNDLAVSGALDGRG
jgi:ketosteroid isomerase-like protein